MPNQEPNAFMRALLIALIHNYQRHLSPRKGFGCAYRLHTGGASCSALGARAVRRHGAWVGLLLVRERTRRCGVLHRRHAVPARPRLQRGFCDAGCDLPCDASGCHLSPVDACDAASCCDCGGCDDWPWSRRKKGEERHVAVRPQVGRPKSADSGALLDVSAARPNPTIDR